MLKARVTKNNAPRLKLTSFGLEGVDFKASWRSCLCSFAILGMAGITRDAAGVTATKTPLRATGSRLSSSGRGAESGQRSALDGLLDGIQKKYSRMQGIAADFAQTYIGQDGRVLKEGGRVLLKRPRKARWDYLVPERKVFIADGKNIFFYVYGEREATRTPIKGSVDPQIPFLFLLSSVNLRKEFSIIEIASGQSPSVSGDIVLHLVPRRAPEEFKSLYAEIDPQSTQVRRLIVHQRSGSTMDFVLTNVKENSVAPDAEFVFRTPSGVVIRRAE